MRPSSILVLGVGNQLMRDEGVGPRIITELRDRCLTPDAIELVDAGTLGLGMMHLLRDREYVLIVDAIDGTGHPPGTVVRTSPENFAPNQILHSLHDIRLVDVLQAAMLAGIEPPTECIGVQIEDISPEEYSVGLTDAVETAIPRAVAAVCYVLAERGVMLEIRELPSDDDFSAAVRSAYAEMCERLGEPGA